MIDDELDVCPFCGRKPRLTVDVFPQYEEKYLFRIECVICRVSMMGYDRDLLVKRWNKRYGNGNGQ